MIRTRNLLIATLIALAACSDSDNAADTADSDAAPAASQQQQADKDLGDINDYRLTMDGMNKFFEAQRNLGIAASKLSPAEREAMEAKNDAESSDGSLDQMIRRIEENKMANDAVRKAGLSAREYTMITFAMMQAAMAASVLQMRPNDNQDSLAREMKANPENIKFMQEHQAEFARRQEEMAAEMKRLGLDDDGDEQ
jgi:hypothetical protein